MQTAQLDGGFADPARDAAMAFRAALDAMARPGTIAALSGATAPAPCSGAAATLLVTLCDATTPLYLAPSHDTGALRDWITFQTGAPLVDAPRAMFALGTWEALHDLGAFPVFPVGTSEYPDRAATLIVEAPELAPEGAVLTGPGIKTEARLTLPEIAAFQRNRAAYPLGLDFFFTCGDRVASLPRSTRVTEG